MSLALNYLHNGIAEASTSDSAISAHALAIAMEKYAKIDIESKLLSGLEYMHQ